MADTDETKRITSEEIWLFPKEFTNLLAITDKASRTRELLNDFFLRTFFRLHLDEDDTFLVAGVGHNNKIGALALPLGAIEYGIGGLEGICLDNDSVIRHARNHYRGIWMLGFREYD